MENLPQVLSAEELRTLDVAGLIKQLALAHNSNKYLERLKVLKTMIRAEKE